jgi:hypothetical protein
MLDVKQPYSNYSGKENDRKLNQSVRLKPDGETCDQYDNCDGGISENNAIALTFLRTFVGVSIRYKK